MVHNIWIDLLLSPSSRTEKINVFWYFICPIWIKNGGVMTVWISRSNPMLFQWGKCNFLSFHPIWENQKSKNIYLMCRFSICCQIWPWSSSDLARGQNAFPCYSYCLHVFSELRRCTKMTLVPDNYDLDLVVGKLTRFQK